jgi:hypothetical protein
MDPLRHFSVICHRSGYHMFRQPIVFVIGAGASCEYGLPSGAALLLRISTALGGPDPGQGWGDSGLFQTAATLFGESLGKYENAAKELARYISSGVSSIDDALTWFSSRAEVIKLGKIAIVNEILKGERSSSLYSGRSKIASGDFRAATWIPHLLSMVMDGHTSENAEQAFSNVSLINFNYDRAIEHFLYSSLQDRGINEARTRRIIDEMFVLRPYGKVGLLPWQGSPGIDFGASLDPSSLHEASGNIRTFSEGVGGTLQAKLSMILGRARVVVFLGFGFHTQNMEMLRVGNAEVWKSAYATAMSIQEQNYPDLSILIATTVGCSRDNTVLLNWSAHNLLTDLQPAIMAAVVR